MSREHVQNYYNQVLSSYLDMLEMLNECEDLLKSGKVSNEQKHNLELMMEPVKRNYQTVSWFMYELNKPNRGSKLTRYEKRMLNKMKKLDPDNEFSPQSIYEQNEEALSDLAHELLYYNEQENVTKQQEETFDNITEWALEKMEDSEGVAEVKATLGEDAFNYYKAVYEDEKIELNNQEDNC